MLSLRFASLWLILMELGAGCGSSSSTTETTEFPPERDGLTGVYTAEDLQEILDGFSWENTQLWPETSPDGLPAFYYAEMLVTGAEDLDELMELGLIWDRMPLFPEEEALWLTDEQATIIDIAYIPAGQLIFVVLPAAFFNEVRTMTLEEGDQLYPLIRQRPAPANWVNADGSLKAHLLVERDLIPEASGNLGGPQTKGLGKFIRRIARAVRRAVDGVREIIGAIPPKRTVEVDLAVVERNVDVNLGQGSIAYRAWGDEAGRRRLLPEGARIWVATKGGGLTAGRVNSTGIMQLRVPKAKIMRVSTDLENHAAVIAPLGLYVRRSLVHGQVIRDPREKSNVRVVLRDATHDDLHLLAVLTDAFNYTKETFEFAPRRAVVSPIGSGRSAVLAESLLSVRTLDRDVYIPGALAKALIDFDIIMALSSRRSRVIVYHEYGHWVLANMLYRSSPRGMNMFWANNIRSAVHKSNADRRDHVSRIINEGFADFFAVQTTGGVNYADYLMGQSRPSGTSSVVCHWGSGDLVSLCAEDNLGSHSVPFYSAATGSSASTGLNHPLQETQWAAVSRDSEAIIGRGASMLMTLLVDLVDGGNNRNLSAGFLWSARERRSFHQLMPWKHHRYDERVAMRGSELRRAFEIWIRDWSLRQSPESFARGAARYDDVLEDGLGRALFAVARERHSSNDVCDVFALHHPTHRCAYVNPQAAAVRDTVQSFTRLEALSVYAPNLSSPSALVIWDTQPRRLPVQVVLHDQGQEIAHRSTGTASVWAAAGLWFNRRYDVTVTDNSSQFAPQTRSVSFVTHAEPARNVRFIHDSHRSYSGRLVWSPVDAARYVVQLTVEDTGNSWEVETPNTHVVIDGWRGDVVNEARDAASSVDGNDDRVRRMSARVYSVNSEGVRTTVRTPVLQFVLRDLYPLTLMSDSNQAEEMVELREAQTRKSVQSSDGHGCEIQALANEPFLVALQDLVRQLGAGQTLTMEASPWNCTVTADDVPTSGEPRTVAINCVDGITRSVAKVAISEPEEDLLMLGGEGSGTLEFRFLAPPCNHAYVLPVDTEVAQ